MERNLEREKYYLDTNYTTKVNEHWFAGQENVLYNHAVKV